MVLYYGDFFKLPNGKFFAIVLAHTGFQVNDDTLMERELDSEEQAVEWIGAQVSELYKHPPGVQR